MEVDTVSAVESVEVGRDDDDLPPRLRPQSAHDEITVHTADPRGTSERPARDSAGTLDGDARIPAETPGSLPRDSTEALAPPARVFPAAPQGAARGPEAARGPDPRDGGGTHQRPPGGCNLRDRLQGDSIDTPIFTPIDVVDTVAPRCPACRGKRTRQYKGINPENRQRARDYRMLCAPCQRAMWIRHRDRSTKPIEIDPPAPQCPQCHRRPRANKGTRRGTRRYFALCAPCDRARREDLGLPAYRGEEGRHRWLRNQVRGVPRQTRHRAGKPIGPRPEWMNASFLDSPDPADRPLGPRNAGPAPAAREEGRVFPLGPGVREENEGSRASGRRGHAL